MFRGLFFVNTNGGKDSLKDLEVNILDKRASVQSKYPKLIGVTIDTQEEYGLSRSFRRCLNLKMLNEKVPYSTFDRNNKQRRVGRTGARKVKVKIRDYYTDVLYH